MGTIRRVTFTLVLCTSILYAADPPVLFKTRFEARLDLFAGTELTRLSFTAEPVQNTLSEKKSVGLAAVYSLLLPGMGELYANGFSSGKYFLIAEGALWLTYTTFEVYGNALRDDARALATSRAGVTLEGKDDQYFIDIGNFVSIEEYNDKQLRDREPERLYPVSGYAWDWKSDALRASYREQRIRSETMYNNRKFVVAAIIVNHVASAINAARSAISHNNAVDDQLGDLRFHATVMGGLDQPHGVLLTVTKGL
jgi:hypothetical protein